MLNYLKIPNPSMEYGLRLYIEQGIMPGDFLTSLLSNDLVGAFATADRINKQCMEKWAQWLWMEMPSRGFGLWGSREIMEEYCKKKRKEFHEAQADE